MNLEDIKRVNIWEFLEDVDKGMVLFFIVNYNCCRMVTC